MERIKFMEQSDEEESSICGDLCDFFTIEIAKTEVPESK